MMPNKTPEISVIVPVYNVAQYLTKCVQSVLGQTINDQLEFIFIDDASTDNSLHVLLNLIKEYPSLTQQIKIINHSENKGILFTRNEGVRLAKGKYIIQIDSDDWIEHDMLEKMLASGQKMDADIIGCDIVEEYGSASKRIPMQFDLPKETLLRELIKGGKIKSYLPIRLIRRDYYLKYGLSVPRGISLYEDRCICLPLHFYSQKTIYLPLPLYHYRQTVSNSLTKKITYDSFKSAWRSIRYMRDFLMNVGEYENYHCEIEVSQSNVASWLIIRSDIYNPTLWNRIKTSVDTSVLPLYKRICIFLVNHNCYNVNLSYVKALRWIKGIMSR